MQSAHRLEASGKSNQANLARNIGNLSFVAALPLAVNQQVHTSNALASKAINPTNNQYWQAANSDHRNKLITSTTAKNLRWLWLCSDLV